jgi:hypothetical protein
MSLTYPKCKVCGRIDKFDYNVPDEIWASIVPEEFQNRVVCLTCFDDFAKEKDISYDEYIKTLYFAGKRGNFTFTTLSHCR